MANGFVQNQPQQPVGAGRMTTPPIVAQQSSRMAGFGNQIQGLLSNPLFNLGTGLLAASGPSREPVGFGQALASGMQFASQRQAEQMKLQMAREEMEAARSQREIESQQRQAIKEFSGLLSPGQTPGPVVSATPAAINTPEGQSRAMGLLGQIYPQAFAQQAAARQFAAPAEAPRVSTSVNDFILMNPDLSPGSPEFRNQFKEFTQQQDPSGALTDQVQLQLLSLQLENARTERAQNETTRTQEVAATRRDVNSDLSKLQEMARLNERLQGTFLEAGMVNPDLRRDTASVIQGIQQTFGADTTEAKQRLADFDRFQKLTQDFVINSIDRFATSGSLTNNKFDALLSSNASLGASPQANNLIFADNINAILDASEIEGIDIPNAQSLRDLAGNLKKAAQPQSAAPVNIETMPLDEFKNLETDGMTAEQLGAVMRRAQREGL